MAYRAVVFLLALATAFRGAAAHTEVSDGPAYAHKNIAHLTFGAGPHVCRACWGAETTMAINELLNRLPDLHLDPTTLEPVIHGVALRSLAALPVEFTPS